MSESKFRENPAAFIPHIQNPNRKALEKLITKPEVERKLLIRLQKKAATYAQDIGIDTEILPDGSPKISGYGVNGSAKIDVDGVVDLYESYIIPLTKEVEVRIVPLASSSSGVYFKSIGGVSSSSIRWSFGRRD